MDAERLAYIVKLNDQEELSREDVAALIAEVRRQDALLAWIDEKPECRAAQFRALQENFEKVSDAVESLLSDYEQFDQQQAGLALALYDAGREVFGCYETCQCDPKPEDCDECAPRAAVLKALRAKVAAKQERQK